MPDAPLLDQVTEAAAQAPPPPPLSMVPQMLPMQWAINKATLDDGQKIVVVTIHQPNQMIHFALDHDAAKRLAAQLVENSVGLTLATTMP